MLDEESEVQRGELTCLSSSNWEGEKMKNEARSSIPNCCVISMSELSLVIFTLVELAWKFYGFCFCFVLLCFYT